MHEGIRVWGASPALEGRHRTPRWHHQDGRLLLAATSVKVELHATDSVAHPTVATAPALGERVLKVHARATEQRCAHGVEVARYPSGCQSVPHLEVEFALDLDAAPAWQLRSNHRGEMRPDAGLVVPGRGTEGPEAPEQSQEHRMLNRCAQLPAIRPERNATKPAV